MTPEQKLNVQHWAAVLRSGAYPKAKHALKNAEGYCCLGVLCEIHEIPFKNEDGYMFSSGENGYSMPPQFWFEATTGLPQNYADRLAHINDGTETFADVILEIESFLEKA